MVLKRRYRLLPLLYRLALEARETGMPIVRPMVMHFDAPDGLAPHQFMLGDRLMAAPVLEKGATRRRVWLPSGSWTHWLTGQTCAGGQTIAVDAPLGMTPMFVRDCTAFMCTLESGLRIGLERRERSFAPLQREFEVVLTPSYRSISIDGVATGLRPSGTGTDGRGAASVSARVPLSAAEILCT